MPSKPLGQVHGIDGSIKTTGSDLGICSRGHHRDSSQGSEFGSLRAQSAESFVHDEIPVKKRGSGRN
jgi:hypothetical protein